jgi:hypothetical protein
MSGNSEWHYPVIDKGSRISVHAQRSNEVEAFAQDLTDGGTRFSVVKAVDDLGWLLNVKDANPDTIIMARLSGGWEGCGGVEKPEFDMEVHATRAIGLILDKIDDEPRLAEAVDYWEVYNEPDPPGAVGYRRLSELMIKTMDLAEAHDLKIAIFSLNAGTPEWFEMEAMVGTGVFGRAREGGHILALHEGTFDTHDPKSYWGDTIPGSPEVEGAGPYNFRYRYLYHLLEQRDECVPLVVSEWYCGDERSASTQTLVDAVTWYDNEASKDYYVWGVCPFTLGPTGQWTHTDYERVYPGLVGHMVAVKDRQNALPEVMVVTADVPWTRDISGELARNDDCPGILKDGWWQRTTDQITGLTFHHTLSHSPYDTAAYYIHKTGGRPSIPYTIWITQTGEILHCLPLTEGCWHDHTGHKNVHLSVGLAGSLHLNRPPEAQLEATARVAEWAVTSDMLPGITSINDIKGHKDFWPTDCPGWEAHATGVWKDDLYARIRNLLHEAPPPPKRGAVAGVHAAPVLSPPDNIDFWVGELQAMGVEWLKMLDNGDPRNVEWCRRLVEAGITPIVRLFEAHQFPGRLPTELICRVSELVSVGVEYFEIANEPNLSGEWEPDWEDKVDYHDPALVGRVASDWWADAQEVIRRGGKPAFPAMAPTERGGTNPRFSSVEWARRILMHLVTNNGAEFKEYLRDGTIWIATHTSPFNRPFDYDPNRGSFKDDMCLRGYEVLRDFCQLELNIKPVIIATEGGCYSPEHLDDLGWTSPYSEQDWGRSTAQMYDWLVEQGDLTALCTWTLSDARVADPRWVGSGWYDKDNNPRSPVAAMKQRAHA